MNTPATRTEMIAHDERLLELYAERSVLLAKLDRARRNVYEYADAAQDTGIVRKSTRSGATFTTAEGRPLTVGDAIVTVEKLANGQLDLKPSYSSWRNAAETLGRYHEACREASDSVDRILAHEEDYTGWSRYFLVVSSAGHVHSSTHCSTCKVTTAYAPVPSLSGSTEAEAVETLGETLCTVCFPSAPVKPSKITAAAATKLLTEGEAAFLADRQAKLAKDAAAAAVECSGSGTWGYDRSTARLGYMSGNAATCDTCGQRVGVTASNKLRKHAGVAK